MKNIHRTTNEGLQRLVESYTPKISTSDILDFLKKKGFDTSSEVTQNYADGVFDLLIYSPDPVSLEDWYEETKFNYPEDLEDLPRLDEALSDEAKANNEMIQRILNKKPSQLTAEEKKFLADNDLVRKNGKGGYYHPYIKKNGAPSYNGISKGNRIYTGHDQNGRIYANIDDVDQLNLLKKRDERSRARREASKDPDILEPLGRGGDSILQHFNGKYQGNIAAARNYADRAKQYKDMYDETGNSYYQLAANHYKGYNRVLRDQAKKDLKNRPKFSESLEDDDYFDFVHDLSTAVKERTKRWQSRGVSASDVAKALDELSVRFEETDDFDEE